MTASSAAVGIGGFGISPSTCNGLCNEPEAATASGVKEGSTNVAKIARRQRSLANRPSFQGVPAQSNRKDYEIRALIETLRGNLDDAQQRWAEIEKLPAAALTFRRQSGIRHAELDLWRGAPQVAFDRAHTLLVQSASAIAGDLEAN